MEVQLPGKILVVDDDQMILVLISTLLKSAGYETDTAIDGEKALEMSKENDYWLAISDISMPNMSGLEFFRKLKAVKPDVPVILITAHAQFDYVSEALALGAIAYILKPIDIKEMLRRVEQVRNLHLERKGRELALKHLVSKSNAMEFETLTLMDKEIFYAITNYLAAQFVPDADNNKLSYLKVALTIHEALRNSLEHGNLELPSHLKSELFTEDFKCNFEKESESRLQNPAFAKRKVFIKLVTGKKCLELKIRDEGDGFDHRAVMGSSSNAPDSSLHGRGIMLMRSGMDSVSYNDSGNEVTLTNAIGG